ncbi:MAG: 3-phosphoshikimate 1-carboxyvinyltransferase [Muribaculaceae bacterium]|nr:3-phosphoshikimate 1-carboxyvinyltransferase [Muribaculaceae bacterium]
MNCHIFPPEEFIETSVSLPLSKSISNRALIINALTPNAIDIKQVAKCDDTDVMVAALSSTDSDINIGAAGTAMRFLTAYYAATPGRNVTLDGSERMRQRPISALVNALRDCGADITYAANEGFPPLTIKGSRLKGGNVSLPATISSQYISALLMIAPTMENGLTLTLEGDIISQPYILMTLSMMKSWGIESDFTQNVITIAPQTYKATPFKVEADWSAASYWYEIAALSSGDISLQGLDRDSLQGDSHIAQLFELFGINTVFDNGITTLEPSPDTTPRLNIDLSDQPDVAQTIVVTACMLGIPFNITGLSTLKIKETDRLEALRCEMLKLGMELIIENDSKLSWDGNRMPIAEIPAIDTYKDHRMAMAFAPAALYIPGIIINDIDVVSKSYPDFWRHLQDAGFTFAQADTSDN